jgi:glycosyltransferase involved in cell wall biosynthesis
MRILMIAPEPIFEPRGTPLSVVGRLKAYSDLGHEVDLLTYSMGADVRLPRVRIHRVAAIPGIRKVKIGPSLAKLPLDFLLAMKSLAWASRRRHDLIHTHEEAGLWGVWLSRWFGIPHVYDMHSSLPQQLGNFQFSRSRLLVRVFEAVEDWVLAHADAVIPICPDLADHVRRKFPEKNSLMIENVVDYGMVFGEEDRSAAIRKTLGRGPVVLYTGTFEPYQGLDLLVAAAVPVVQKVPDVRFLLVGGHPDQVDAVRKSIAARGLSSRFTFTGQVKPQEVNSYIRCADVLVSPRTRGTNTPLKLYAYLRSGVPMAATRLWTHTQVLNDQTAVLTDPDPAAFAAGILRLLKDRTHARRIAGAAAALAEAKYSYRIYLEKLNRVVESVCECLPRGLPSTRRHRIDWSREAGPRGQRANIRRHFSVDRGFPAASGGELQSALANQDGRRVRN